MENKTLGIGIAISLGLAILTVVFETALPFQVQENLYGLAGIGLFFFGIWGAIRLINS
jgi:hypothetical protein